MFRIVIGLLCSAGFLGVGCQSKTTNSSGGGTNEPTTTKPEPLGKPDVTLDAVAWKKEFEKGQQAAEQKYKDKVIELSGVVSMISDDPFDTVGYVHLDVPKDILGVRCVTTDKKPWLTLSVGSKVKIKGKSSPGGLPGDLLGAEISDPGP